MIRSDSLPRGRAELPHNRLLRAPPYRRLLRGLFFGVFAWLTCASALPGHAQSFRRDAGVTFVGDSLAAPRGALSLSTNPAGLTDLWGWETRAQLSAGGGFLGGTKGNGVGIFHGFGSPLGSAMGISYEAVWDAVGEATSGGSSVGLHRFSFGGGFRFSQSLRFGYAIRLGVSEEPESAAPLYGDIGLIYRPWSWISLGARVRSLSIAHFGRGAVIERFPQTRYGWGLALRPFAGSDRFTATVDVDWPAGDKIGDITWSLRSRVVDGVEVLLEQRQAQQNESTGLPNRNDQRTMLMVSLGFGGFGGDLSFGGATSQVSADTAAVQFGVRVSGDHPHSLRDRGPEAVLVKLRGAYTEHAGGNVFTRLILQMEELARRPKTRLVVLRAEGLRLTWGQVEELRTAIAELRRAGKKVVMYADDLGTRGMMVAAACDKIGMPDYGTLTAKGVGTGFIGLRQALSRLGVAVDAVRFGDFKSAPEQFTRTAISDPLRATLTRLVRRRWQAVAEAVALGRQMTTTDVEAALESGIVFPADAQKARFIDVVAGPKAFEKQLRTWGYLAEDEPLEHYSRDRERPATWGEIPVVAVVAVTGTIVGGSNGKGLLGRETGGAQVARHLRQLTGDKQVKAVAVRIDSPGGSVSGSEIMYRALRKAAKQKPVYASMASVAASGGYWTAMGADLVYANKATVTGSIGIFTLKPSFGGLWDKLGVGLTLIGAGPHPTITSIHKPWSAAERAVMQKTMGSYYGLFLDRVSKHRKIDRQRLLTLAEGRIWLGDEAQQRDLVDHIGGVSATLRGIRAKLNLSLHEPMVVSVWPELSSRDRVLRTVGLANAFAPRSALDDPAIAPLVRVLRPWIDAARLAVILEPGAPLALSQVPMDAPEK